MNLARLVACAALGLTAFSAARVIAQQPNASQTAAAAPENSLSQELERCRLLNEKAIGDARCDSAYRENQRLFFQPPSPYRPEKVEMFHETPSSAPAHAAPPARDK